METNKAHGTATGAHQDRATLRRIATASAAGVAVIAALAGCSTTGKAAADSVPTPPATEAPGGSAPTENSATAPAGQPAAKPAPTAQRKPTKAATQFRLGPWQSRAAKSLPGTAHYRTTFENGRVQVHILKGGVVRTATLEGTLSFTYDCAAETATVSPDGTSVAWVEGDASDPRLARALVVAPIAGGAPKVVARNVHCSGGMHPQWLPDSHRMVVSPQRGGVSLLDVRTGALTAQPATRWTGYMGWSPNGAYRAYQSQDGKLAVETAAGALVRTVALELEEWGGGFAALTVSPDGRYVGVGRRNTDPQVFRGASWLVDTVTGKKVALPVKAPADGRHWNLKYAGGGAMLVSTVAKDYAQTLYLVKGGKKVASIPFPAGAHVETYLP